MIRLDFLIIAAFCLWVYLTLGLVLAARTLSGLQKPPRLGAFLYMVFFWPLVLRAAERLRREQELRLEGMREAMRREPPAEP